MISPSWELSEEHRWANAAFVPQPCHLQLLLTLSTVFSGLLKKPSQTKTSETTLLLQGRVSEDRGNWTSVQLQPYLYVGFRVFVLKRIGTKARVLRGTPGLASHLPLNTTTGSLGSMPEGSTVLLRSRGGSGPWGMHAYGGWLKRSLTFDCSTEFIHEHRHSPLQFWHRVGTNQ